MKSDLYFYCAFQEEQAKKLSITNLYSEIVTVLGMSRKQANAEIFLAGLDALHDQFVREGKRSPDPVRAMIREARLYSEQFESLRECYHLLGREQFLERVSQPGANVDPAMVERVLNSGTRPLRRTEWLKNYMDDGLEHPCEEVRQAAVADEVLAVGDEVGWSAMKEYASNKRYTTNHKGVWQKPAA